MSIFWQNSTNLAKKCSTTPVGPVHSSPATQLDARVHSEYWAKFTIARIHQDTVLLHTYANI